MISIIDDIINLLKLTEYPINDVAVREAYQIGDVLNAPLVTIQENLSNEGTYIDNKPDTVKNLYVLEYYATQSSIVNPESFELENALILETELGKPIFIDGQDNIIFFSAMQTGRILSVKTDEALTNFGLTMIGNTHAAPYQDPNIVRIVANYYGYIDTKTKQIYRRIKI